MASHAFIMANENRVAAAWTAIEDGREQFTHGENAVGQLSLGLSYECVANDGQILEANADVWGTALVNVDGLRAKCARTIEFAQALQSKCEALLKYAREHNVPGA